MRSQWRHLGCHATSLTPESLCSAELSTQGDDARVCNAIACMNHVCNCAPVHGVTVQHEFNKISSTTHGVSCATGIQLGKGLAQAGPCGVHECTAPPLVY